MIVLTLLITDPLTMVNRDVLMLQLPYIPNFTPLSKGGGVCYNFLPLRHTSRKKRVFPVHYTSIWNFKIEMTSLCNHVGVKLESSNPI